MNNKILLVDDQEDITSSLKRVLADYPVASAGDGKTALEFIRAEGPALVILDVSMPGMSGLEVLEQIMLMERKPLVLMLTGDETIETAARSLAIGAFAYITKPYDTEQVKEQVRKAFSFLERTAPN